MTDVVVVDFANVAVVTVGEIGPPGPPGTGGGGAGTGLDVLAHNGELVFDDEGDVLTVET